jgi:putative nucleotidyltransferase with HDIG domain
MNKYSTLRGSAKVYVTTVVLAGAGIITHSVHSLYVEPVDSQWFVLALLTLLTGSFTVKVPSISAYLSVSETFVFASVLMFGAEAGALTVALECLVITFWMKPSRGSGHKILFNTAAPAIAIWVSARIFFATGIQPYSIQPGVLQQLFLPLLVFTTLYFLLNSWLVAIALGFESDRSALTIWWKNFTWLSVNYFSGASVAALIVTYTREIDFSTLAIIVPLLVISYLTFRTAMGRVEDTNRHLSELNSLYLSTIETLAMAIDAKDQITHGHIRRVQAYAVKLAKRVGVTEDQLIKAIEAAALLHDMGKLAVPEYILNKPGKLSPAEFAKMKLHASIGADILSAINFPYPVVPIVRHHHENWDGSGYPAGLKGTDIPIGARILAVVDCFDALTSDRPYRPRLTDQEALRILEQRRGSMYDPLIIDTFASVYQEVAHTLGTGTLPGTVLEEITAAVHLRDDIDTSLLDNITASSDEMLTMFELMSDLAGQRNTSEACHTVSKHLRRLVPFAVAIVYLYDDLTDEIVAKYSMGTGGALTADLRISRGQRLSGWVAANRQTVVNSDPALDFGDLARTFIPRLRSSLSTPLVCGDVLVGVLTLYSTVSDGFSEDHKRVVERVASHVAPTFRLDESSLSDTTQLPSINHLEQLLRDEKARRPNPQIERQLIWITFDSTDITRPLEDHASSLGSIVGFVKSHILMKDAIFHAGNLDLIVLLHEADVHTANTIAEKLRHSLTEGVLPSLQQLGRACSLAVCRVSWPGDGLTVTELGRSAALRPSSRRRERSTHIH